MTPDDLRFENEKKAEAVSPIPETGMEETEAVAIEKEPMPSGGGGIAQALYSWAADLVGCLVFVILIFTFLAKIVGVDGSSMVPTLHDHDMVLLLCNTLYTPRNEDIVVITKESFGEPIVKRVIATGGQSVDIDFDTHQVWVDGVLLDEPYINEPTAEQGDMTFPLTVPEGSVFVMGDNRNDSIDSRYGVIGIVDNRCVLGRVLFRVFPFTDIGKIE